MNLIRRHYEINDYCVAMDFMLRMRFRFAAFNESRNSGTGANGDIDERICQ